MNDDNNVVPLRRGNPPDLMAMLVRGTDRRSAVRILLDQRGAEGMTWSEVSQALGIHHGAASALLSHMHREQQIARLALDHREGSSVYVLPQYVAGRQTLPAKRSSELTHDLAAMVERLHTGCSHPEHMPHPTCKQCQMRELLVRYRRLGR